MDCSAQRKVHVLSASLANQNEVHPKLEKFKKDSEMEEINRQGWITGNKLMNSEYKREITQKSKIQFFENQTDEPVADLIWKDRKGTKPQNF